ncbi:MAG: hypothetical protein J4F41_05935, partial [Alphaproteobacteria bacterium]|nr:hypothetical protein [Alphaproteobacteria bacterium]
MTTSDHPDQDHPDPDHPDQDHLDKAPVPQEGRSRHVARPQRLSVMVATALPFGDGVLDYLADSALPRGQIVTVPLGSRQLPGVVMGPAEDHLEGKKLKPVISTADLPPLDEGMLNFITWVASWTMSPPGAVLKMVLPLADALAAPAGVKGWMVAAPLPQEGLTATRQRVAEALKGLPPMTTREAAELTAVSSSTITAMGKAGILAEVEMIEAGPKRPAPNPSLYTLTGEQA